MLEAELSPNGYEDAIRAKCGGNNQEVCAGFARAFDPYLGALGEVTLIVPATISALSFFTSAWSAGLTFEAMSW
ncbi:MAG: hypothetical protein JWM49_2947 [Microbacteriaceae bacterium]|nr:hypothetical protein [Microbacteriaceae bacterium]